MITLRPSLKSCIVSRCTPSLIHRPVSGQVSGQKTEVEGGQDGEFRVLQILPEKSKQWVQRPPPKFRVNTIQKGRFRKLSPNKEWRRVWPAARVFHPAVVPLPVHMGYIERPDLYSAPDKWNNLELMKIPNFLHLTPPAIKVHCEAMKRFCTKWPEELKRDEDCWRHFPLEYIYTDYVHSLPSIRNPYARIVKLRFKLDSLPLDDHARDKLKRVLNCKKERYDLETGIVTLVADKCPLKKQNYDYINYLLTACFFESWKTEPWESEKELNDWECFYWEKSDSFQRLKSYLEQVEEMNVSREDLNGREDVEEYKEAVTAIYDEGEDEGTVTMYKKSVLKLLDMDRPRNQPEDKTSTSETELEDSKVSSSQTCQ